MYFILLVADFHHRDKTNKISGPTPSDTSQIISCKCSVNRALASQNLNLSRCVKCRSINENSRKENFLFAAVFTMSQPTNLKFLIYGQYFSNLQTKSKSYCNEPLILQDTFNTFMLESPQVFLFQHLYYLIT